MSGYFNVSLSISGNSYGTMTPLIQNASATKQELEKLTAESSSGLISQVYSGLTASAASTVLTISPQIAAANAQISEISAASGQMTVQANALGQISTLVAGVQASLGTISSVGSSNATSVIGDAQQALQQVVGILNTQNGNDYVFGGQDSGEAPVPSANNFSSTGFYTQIQAAVSNLSANGTAATYASVLAIGSSTASGTSPFTQGLENSTGLPSVVLSNGETVTTGIAANANGFVTSTGTGTTSTGSYMRDILAGLTAIASMPASETTSSDFNSFVQKISTTLENGMDALDQDTGVLGNTQTQLANQSTALGSTVTALTNQVSAADGVDTASVLTQLSTVQTSLDDSYELIASLKTTNLATYLE